VKVVKELLYPCRYPMDILICSALGADMFDSVYPTRTGRFGTALVHGGMLKLRNTAFAHDTRRGADADTLSERNIDVALCRRSSLAVVCSDP
jgi:tRNA-guanine family transglycosylase